MGATIWRVISEIVLYQGLKVYYKGTALYCVSDCKDADF